MGKDSLTAFGRRLKKAQKGQRCCWTNSRSDYHACGFAFVSLFFCLTPADSNCQPMI